MRSPLSYLVDPSTRSPSCQLTLNDLDDTIPELLITLIPIPILIVSILGSWQVRYDTENLNFEEH